MPKFAFINLPIHSHINPTLPVVQELVRRGEKVIYYLTETYRASVEATGATFQSYESLTEKFASNSRASGKPAELPMRMVDESLFVIPQILEHIRAEQVDCIVYDNMCLSGRFLAQILQIPAVIYRPIFVFNARLARIFQSRAQDPEAVKTFQAAVEKLCSRYALPPFDVASIFLHEEPLNIVTLPRAFQMDGDSFGDRYRFVGPCIAPRHEKTDFPFEQLEQLGNQPILYITQGTVFNDQPDFFNMCFAAFANTPWRVVISIGKSVDLAKLDPVPSNVLVRRYLPQLDILQRTSVFINHGAMTSIMESLSLGVPMVVIPQDVSDQRVNSVRVAELGLGVMLEKSTLTTSALYDAVMRISKDPTFYARAVQMQDEIRSAGGYQRAAQDLLEFVKAHSIS